MGKQSNTSGNERHAISWLALLAGIPVIVIIMTIWYAIVSWIVDLLSQRLTWLYELVLGDYITNAITVLSGLLLLRLANRINKLSHQIYPSKYATRYIVTGVIAGILTILGAICTLLGYIPFRVPVQLGRGILFSTTYAMGIYAYQMIYRGIRIRKISKSISGQPQTICVFGYVEKRPNAPFQPFCYITDSPGLMNPDGSLNKKRGSDPEYLRRFEKMKQVALDKQNCPSDAYQHNLLAYSGFIAGERVYFMDMFSIDTLTGKDSYTNLYDPNDRQQNIQGIEIAVLKRKKHYRATANGTFVPADGTVFTPTPTRTAVTNTQPKKARSSVTIADTLKKHTDKKPKTVHRQKTLEEMLEENRKISAQISSSPKTTQEKPQPKPAPKPKASPTKANTGKTADKPKIYLLLDSSLSAEDRSLIGKAASEVNKLFSMCDVVNMDNSPRAETNRKNADTYLEGTISGGQADSSVVIRKLQNAYTALPNAATVILLTARDLYSSSLGLSWCFGAANYGKHVSVQSVFRYQKLTKAEKLRCIRRTLRHELGHTFGLANDLNRVNTEDHFGHHCTAPRCSMRQAETLSELLQCSAEEDRLGTYFCKDCLADLNRYFSKNAPAKKPAATTQASKPAPRQTPVTEKTLKSREELLDAIFEYYGADIFASAERLHIHLENVFDLRKETYNTATLKAILDDLKEHASK